MARARITVGPRTSPITTYRYAVRFEPGPAFDSARRFGFQTVSGLGVEIDGLDYPEGTDLQTVRRLSGPSVPELVTFGRAYDLADRDVRFLVDWFRDHAVSAALRGRYRPPTFSRKTITIDSYRRDGGEPAGARFVLHACVPRRIEFSDLDAMSSGILISRITVAPEALEMVNPPEPELPVFPFGVRTTAD